MATKRERHVPSRSHSSELLITDLAHPKGRKFRVKVSTAARHDRAATAAEVSHHVRVLEDNRQISRRGTLRSGETHAIETVGGDEPRLVRKRFSAI
jgi:hypothetical protein